MDVRAYALVGAVAHSLQRKEAGSDPYWLEEERSSEITVPKEWRLK
jgi:hypothetical protein